MKPVLNQGGKWNGNGVLKPGATAGLMTNRTVLIPRISTFFVMKFSD